MDINQIREFIKTVEDIQTALKGMFKDTLQEMLKAELDDDLDYLKHDDAEKQTENRRWPFLKIARNEY